ncbi:MAG TPA: flippase [Chloroflexus aurantiacus]|jgi:O-antigen/teichoic acid export membrane protein|uniref:Polysaccharide biosynthesis protein n=1 Tax=Chloroflexus aurantiacus (strain ATCC 29366 / DSM 635 / J-10-fl) TaxID=324602 RepID=A9WBV9_CHLAA|nr:flippase [Chloroflexus aurantiacus]ABY36911.1 polysaccharide biosynthesis protein [Chloroflexus aurantiacus J-10-fl]HBW68400.1 flippase [Chloroflexus aurantiacus]
MNIDRLTLVLLLIGAGLLILGAGAILWRRLYRDDPANTARRIFKNSAITFGLRLFVRGLDTVILLLLVGSLDPAALGAYNTAALLVAQYLATFTEFGLGVLLIREVARHPNAAQRLFGVTLGLRLILIGVAAVPVAWLVITAYHAIGTLGLSEPLTNEGQQAIWILLLTLVPGAYSGAVTALYNAAERMEVPAVIEVFTALLSFLARIGVLVLGWGVIGLAWAAVFVSSITALIFLALQVRTFFTPTLSFDGTALRQLVPQALPLMLNNLLSVIFFRFDLFIVRAFGGSNADLLVQQYVLPYQLLNIALVLPPAVTFAVFPLLARRAGGARSELASAQQRTLHLLLLIAFPLAMLMTVLADDLVWLFARRRFAEYLPSVTVLAVLAWFLPLSFVNGLLQYVLIAIERQTAITRAFVIGAAFNLTANLIAIPLAIRWGRPQDALLAAAVITILSEVVLYMVFHPVLRREGLAPAIHRLMWRPALASLLMAVAMAPAILWLPGWLGSVGAILIGPVVYVAGLWMLGAIGAEELALARRIAGRTAP